MATKPITARQQYWLDHLKRADANGSSLVAYARAQELKPKDLYAWKTRLIQLGHLAGSRKHKGRRFVPVVSAGNAVSATLVIPNGFRLELQGPVDRALLQEPVQVISQAS